MLAQVEYLLDVLNLSASKTHMILGLGLLFKGLRNLRLLLYGQLLLYICAQSNQKLWGSFWRAISE